MVQTPKKEDHIESAISDVKERLSGIKDATANRILAVLSDHTGADLKKSEAQGVAKELIELQVGDGKYLL